jgi:3-hydroxymyristoyl/3-hydroxydecanoyl-(acyl carrier protein) dehydratase
MSGLREQIRSCMSPAECADGRCAASFRFPGDFLGFGGHFPDNPVLPGVCIVQAAVELMQSCAEFPLTLREVRKAAFFAPVTVGEECLFECTYEKGNDGELRARTTVTRNGQKVAGIDLTLATEKAGGK